MFHNPTNPSHLATSDLGVKHTARAVPGIHSAQILHATTKSPNGGTQTRRTANRSTNTGDARFGKISSAFAARQMQLALKLLFQHVCASRELRTGCD